MDAWVAENIPRSSFSRPVKGLGVELLFGYMFKEGLWGMSQEQLLCLGRANDGGMAKLEERLRDGWREVGQKWIDLDPKYKTSGDKLVVVVYWANGDGMIPLKGRGE